jgi:putative N-acetylmannosamine-6-phosphate epimerase
MKTPELAGEIIEAAVKASCVPVTVKMRAGWDEEHINAVELALIAQQAGAAAITVHPRTRVQHYSGHSDWRVIRDVKKAVSIPVIGNGDVTNADEYEQMLRETGCDAVAVGRAAQGNPWIFAEILARVEGREWTMPSPREKIDMALRHGRMQAEYIGAYAAAMNGVDVLVFTGGIGENTPMYRSYVCEKLAFLGVKIDEEKNAIRGEELEISAPDSSIRVFVIPTNEELVIARDTLEIVENLK